MRHIVDPPCTAKLYRALMPATDIRSNANAVYPGIMVARDVSFGPDPKDVVDIFTADKGFGSRPVLIYVPGGAGNKIELQDVEAERVLRQHHDAFGKESEELGFERGRNAINPYIPRRRAVAPQRDWNESLSHKRNFLRKHPIKRKVGRMR